jgi:hypothetical protein
MNNDSPWSASRSVSLFLGLPRGLFAGPFFGGRPRPRFGGSGFDATDSVLGRFDVCL